MTPRCTRDYLDPQSRSSPTASETFLLINVTIIIVRDILCDEFVCDSNCPCHRVISGGKSFLPSIQNFNFCFTYPSEQLSILLLFSKHQQIRLREPTVTRIKLLPQEGACRCDTQSRQSWSWPINHGRYPCSRTWKLGGRSEIQFS